MKNIQYILFFVRSYVIIKYILFFVRSYVIIECVLFFIRSYVAVQCDTNRHLYTKTFFFSHQISFIVDFIHMISFIVVFIRMISFIILSFGIKYVISALCLHCYIKSFLVDKKYNFFRITLPASKSTNNQLFRQLSKQIMYYLNIEFESILTFSHLLFSLCLFFCYFYIEIFF